MCVCVCVCVYLFSFYLSKHTVWLLSALYQMKVILTT